jgi:hypothetical protein
MRLYYLETETSKQNSSSPHLSRRYVKAFLRKLMNRRAKYQFRAGAFRPLLPKTPSRKVSRVCLSLSSCFHYGTLRMFKPIFPVMHVYSCFLSGIVCFHASVCRVLWRISCEGVGANKLWFISLVRGKVWFPRTAHQLLVLQQWRSVVV